MASWKFVHIRTLIYSRFARFIPDQSWSFLTSPDHFWSVLILPDQRWSFLSSPDHSWPVLIISDQSWSFQIIPDKSWVHRFWFWCLRQCYEAMNCWTLMAGQGQSQSENHHSSDYFLTYPPSSRITRACQYPQKSLWRGRESNPGLLLTWQVL